jgi:hypothetical protein
MPQNFGASVNIFDPLFGATTDDSQTAPQMAIIALGTVANTLDGYPDFGFDFDGQVNRALDATALAMLPVEVQGGLLAEPAFVDAQVDVASVVDTGGGGVAVTLSIQVTGAEGDAIGFSLASGDS